MDTRLKHRLVGTAVIVALAVIFLPELLRPVAERQPVVETMDLPPRPVHFLEPTVGEPLLPPSAPEPTQPSTASADRPSPGESEHEPRAALEQAPSPLAENRTEDADRGTEDAADPGEVQSSGNEVPELSANLQAWVVQVGSFAEERNAEALRDKLRAAEFTAFVETAHIGERKMYRVRVGPELEKRVAEQLKDEIHAELQIAGQLRRYP